MLFWPHQNLTVTTDPGTLPTIATEHLPVAGLLQRSAVARGRPSRTYRSSLSLNDHIAIRGHR